MSIEDFEKVLTNVDPNSTVFIEIGEWPPSARPAGSDPQHPGKEFAVTAKDLIAAMVQLKMLSIIDVNQFFDHGIHSPTNEACGAAAAKAIFDFYYPDNKLTLLDVIKMTPLITGQKGLTCEQVMALCLLLGLDARLETMNTDKLKSMLAQDHPVICLLNYGDIPQNLKQDHFNGFHFEVAVGYSKDNQGHEFMIVCDSDRLDPNSNFGQDVRVPMAKFDKALADSDQTRLCVSVYGKLIPQIVKTMTVNSRNGLNLRLQPGTNQLNLGLLPYKTKLAVLSDKAQQANGFTWFRVQAGAKVGWVANQYLS